MILFENEIKEVKKLLSENKKKKEICKVCKIKQRNIHFCFRCPANKFMRNELKGD